MNKISLKQLSQEAVEAVAARFRALSEVSRLNIIQALQNGEKSVTDLVDITGLSQPNVSRHLSVLVIAGLIGRRKDGQNVLYSIIDDHLAELCSTICKSVSAHSSKRK